MTPGKAQIFTVLVAVAASQISMRYFHDPVQSAPKSDSSTAGWAQLSVLLSQGKKGCLCCDDGVTLLPESEQSFKIQSWLPANLEKTKNVTLPGDNGQKITMTLFASIRVVASQPGAQGKTKEMVTEDKDAFCVQACVPKTGFFSKSLI